MTSGESPPIAARAIVRSSTGMIVVGAMVVANLSNYGFQLLASRALGVEEFGLFAGLMSVVSVIAVATASYQTAAAKTLAGRPLDVSHAPILDGLTRSLLRVTLIAGVIVIVTAPVTASFFDTPVVPIVLIGAYIAPSALDSLTIGRFQGLRRFEGMAAYTMSQAVGKLGVAATLLAMGAGVPAVVGGLVMSTFVLGLVGRKFASTGGGIQASHASADVRRSFLALVLFWAAVSLDVLVARAVLDDRSAGIYATASIFGKSVLWISTTLAQLLFPDLARRASTGEGSSAILRRGIVVTVIVACGAVAGLAILGPRLLELLYGDKYPGAGSLAWKIGLAAIPWTLVNLLLYRNLALARSRFLWWLAIAVVAEFTVLATLARTFDAVVVSVGATGALVLAAFVALEEQSPFRAGRRLSLHRDLRANSRRTEPGR